MIATLVLEFRSDQTALVEILSCGHQFSAECFHGGVLLAGIAFGNDDDRRNTELCGGDATDWP